MLRSLRELRRYTIAATDGEIGSVEDFYVDELAWVVRYAVVDTGRWLPGRLVLVASAVLGEPSSWGRSAIPAALTRAQVKESPGIDLARPISRRREAELHAYYGWYPYWGEVMPPAGALLGTPTAVRTDVARPSPETEEESNLRSARELHGYHIEARDGTIGHLEELIAEVGPWAVRYTVVDTRNWLPGKKVLVSPEWIREIDWPGRLVRVDLRRDEIRESPEYDPSAPVNRVYEERLYDFYGRPRYWE